MVLTIKLLLLKTVLEVILFKIYGFTDNSSEIRILFKPPVLRYRLRCGEITNYDLYMGRFRKKSAVLVL
jgi:hypothetical protein